MGSYITTTTIYVDKLSRITTSTVAPTILTAYINDAEAVINGYIAKQYTVASITVARPPLLQTIAKDLTIYYALIDSYTRDNSNLNDWLETKKTNAMSLLEAIADDKVRLVASSGANIDPAVNVNMKSSLSGVNLTFNMDDELEWRVPQTLLDSIDADRSIND
jgi:phage gp36-like protein